MKHKCLDCEDKGVKSERFISRKEATHAARPRCFTCGSPRLEPVSSKKETITSKESVDEKTAPPSPQAIAPNLYPSMSVRVENSKYAKPGSDYYTTTTRFETPIIPESNNDNPRTH